MDAETVELNTLAKSEKKKRFQCGQCERLFARLEHLQRHERIRKLSLNLCKFGSDKGKIVE
jgi:uncharacterized Zn-finger protein